MEDWSEIVSPEDLRHEITLEKHFANKVAELGVSPNPKTVASIQKRCEELRVELEQLAQPGDSWCEWIKGDEPLMQSGGLALIRDGRIVWAKLQWIS